VPRSALRRRRSNEVGSSTPTSTPRWPSRHCTAPGKRLRLCRRPAQRRWCAAHCDLRGPAGSGDQRQARVPLSVTRRTSPALECWPPSQRLGRDRPSADPPTNLSDGLPDDGPQRQRHRDRSVAVVPAGSDPTWHDRQDRLAADAEIAPACDHDPLRRTIHLARAAELAVTEPVTMQSEATPGRPTGSAADDAHSRPSGLG
jgi:hypothetical protein